MAEDKKIVLRLEVQGTSQEAEAISKLDIELQELNAERRKYLKLAKEQGSLDAKQRKQLATVTQEIAKKRRQKAEYNKTQRQGIDLDMTEAGTINNLRKRNAQLRQSMNNLNLETKEGQAQLKKLRVEYDRNNQKVRDFDRQLSGSSTLVGEYSKGFVEAFRKIGFAIFGAITAIKGLSSTYKAMVEDFGSFEQGQLAVQGLLDEWDDTIADRSIGLMREYGLQIQDTNKALFDAVSAGVDAGNSTEFLAEAAQLAIGGVTDLSTAVDGMTSVINGFELELSEANRVAAAFFSAQKFGKTTVAELSEAIGRTAPIAKQLGVQYQELLSVYAELTKQGIKTQESSTAISGIMQGLLKPSSEAEKIFGKLGIAYGTTAVKQEGFLNVLEDVFAEVEKGNAELVEIFPNLRGLTGAGALAGDAFEEMHEILAVVNEDYGEGSSLMKAYELQMNSVEKQTEILGAKIREKRMELGEKLAPAIKWVNENFDALLTGIKSLIVATGTYLGITKGYTVGVKIATAVTRIFNATLKANPIGLVATAIAGLAAGIIYLKGRMKEFNAEAVVANDINKRATEQIADERAEVSALIEIAKDETQSKEERVKAVKELNRISPEYLGNLTLEKINTEEAKKAVEDYNDALMETARVMAAREGLIEVEKQIMDIELNTEPAQEEFTKFGQGVRTFINSLGTGLGGTSIMAGYVEMVGQAGDKINKDLEQLIAKRDEYLKIVREGAGDDGGGGGTPVPEQKVKAMFDIFPEPTEEEIKAAQERAKNLEKAMGRIKIEVETEDPTDDATYYYEQWKLAYEGRAAELQAMLDSNLISEAEYNDKVIALRKEKAAEEAEIEREAKEGKLKNWHQWSEVASGVVNSFANIFEAAKQKELSAAGDNAKKREAIERKYAKKEKAIATGQAIISMAQVILNAMQTKPFVPMGLAMAGVAALAAGAQIAVIANRKFAEGGVVRSGGELPGSKQGADNTLALVKPGEVILNKDQQIRAGGVDFFRKIGVPGFEYGGMVGKMPSPIGKNTAVDTDALINGIGQQLQQLEVVLNINKDIVKVVAGDLEKGRTGKKEH